MDLAKILENLQAMGPAYWVAAAAVALGCTLLITAGVLQWRSRRTGRQRPVHRDSLPITAARDYATQSTSGPAEYRSTASIAADTALTARLAVAAARLETIHAAMATLERLPDGSALKPAPSHVEYVFRAGTA